MKGENLISDSDDGLAVPIRYSMFALAKNKILLRFANIGDKYDYEE